MLLKHAPLPSEIEEGVAFYGRAGGALMKSLKRLQIDPLAVYGTLCVKCPVRRPLAGRPGLHRAGRRGDRDRLAEDRRGDGRRGAGGARTSSSSRWRPTLRERIGRGAAAHAEHRRAVRAQHRRVARRAATPSGSSGRPSARSASGTTPSRRTEPVPVGACADRRGRACAPPERAACGTFSKALSDREHDLAELAAGGEALVGGGGLLQREGRGDRHARACPSSNSGSTSRSSRRAASAFSSSGRARSVEPWMRARFPISARRLSSALAPAATPITTIRPPVASAVQVLGQVGGADQLEDHVEGAVLGEALAGDHRGARAPRPASRASARRTVAVTRAPLARAELDRRRADAAGAAVHQQPLAGAQLAPA